MAYTAQDIINTALWQLGVIGPGQSLSAAQNADLLKVLNIMVGAWSADDTLQLTEQYAAFPTQPNKSIYTIGASVVGTPSDINAIRPSYMTRASVILPGSNSIRRPLDEMSLQEWQRLSPTDLTSQFPYKFFFNPAFDANGYGQIGLYPIPTGIYTVELFYPSAASAFALLTTPVALPDYYIEAMASNVALRYAPMFGKPQDPAILANAAIGLQRIRVTNDVPIQREGLSHGVWNFRTGDFD